MMPELLVFIERIFGITFFFFGLSVLLNAEIWQSAIKKHNSEAIWLYLMTFLFLPVGAILVMEHNIWEFSPRVIITILGWSWFLKSIFFLLFPSQLISWLYNNSLSQKYLRIAGLILVILSTIVLYSVLVN